MSCALFSLMIMHKKSEFDEKKYGLDLSFLVFYLTHNLVPFFLSFIFVLDKQALLHRRTRNGVFLPKIRRIFLEMK